MKEVLSYKKSFLNECVIDYNLIYQNYQIVVFSVVSFAIPFFLKHPQWLIGTIINFFLMKSAMDLKFSKTLPIVIFPSLGVLAAGVLFGESTKFLIYFIPFIWIANFIYVISYKYLRFKKNYKSHLSILLSSFFKFSLLIIATSFYVFLFGFPSIFLVAMGYTQLITALSGGALAYFITRIETKNA